MKTLTGIQGRLNVTGEELAPPFPPFCPYRGKRQDRLLCVIQSVRHAVAHNRFDSSLQTTARHPATQASGEARYNSQILRMPSVCGPKPDLIPPKTPVNLFRNFIHLIFQQLSFIAPLLRSARLLT